MDKLYLVVHKYENTEDAVYLVSFKNLRDFIEVSEGRKTKIYEWDSERIGLQEVTTELKYV